MRNLMRSIRRTGKSSRWSFGTASRNASYDPKANRAAARSRGACPVIPFRKAAKNKPAFFPEALSRGRARIEQAVGKLKRFKRVTLRCEKTAQNDASLVAFGLAMILVKSVHTA